ncbi:hypothetical protein HYT23_01385 [Candidatus Pacearchaeota archaeon]|nr:hypothetical protein [Candidatus Pacearchaeota archaeon]
MTVEQKVIDMKVIGKREDKSLILRRPRYFLALQNIDLDFETAQQTGEKRVEFADYCALNVGAVISVFLFSGDGQKWFYDPIDAELFGRKK